MIFIRFYWHALKFYTICKVMKNKTYYGFRNLYHYLFALQKNTHFSDDIFHILYNAEFHENILFIQESRLKICSAKVIYQRKDHKNVIRINVNVNKELQTSTRQLHFGRLHLTRLPETRQLYAFSYKNFESVMKDGKFWDHKTKSFQVNYRYF